MVGLLSTGPTPSSLLLLLWLLECFASPKTWLLDLQFMRGADFQILNCENFIV